MADFETGEGGHKKGKKHVRAKKMSTRIDMTPMVDLAFLLVTFFMLTTTMAKPKVMQLSLPDKDDKPKKEDANKLAEEEALTLILGGNNKLYYYYGLDNPQVKETDYTEKGVGKIIDDRNKVAKDYQHTVKGRKDIGVWIFIKPTDLAKYENIVFMLDEVKVHNLSNYSLLNLTTEEKKLLADANLK